VTEPRTNRLRDRRVTLGITGSIAAYKAAVVARLLVKAGATVRVIMSASASRFVGASTFGGITGNAVFTDMFDASIGGELHVTLARESDLLLVVPATADFIARLATGRADDLLAATALSAACPVVLAPAMHPAMWTHPATERNAATLHRDGRVRFAGPVSGEVASGDSGLGRMMEPEDIVEFAARLFDAGDLDGRHVVVTAGPTVEDIDPVRFISNRSSGKMGFSLAERAAARGAKVTLIAGPVSLPTPAGSVRVDVRSALEMREAVHAALGTGLAGADALVMCAAVGDFRPERSHAKKLKRKGVDVLELKLVQNPDILAEIGRERRGTRPLLVGFAVETGTDREIVDYARQKLGNKRVDAVVANPAAESLGLEENRIFVIDRHTAEALESLPKRDAADRVLDWLARRFHGSTPVRPPVRTGKKRPSRRVKDER